MKIIYLTVFLFCVSSTTFAQSSASTPKAWKKSLTDYWQAHQEELLTSDRAPLDEKKAKKLKYFKANSKYKLIATFNRTPYAKPFDMMTYSGLSREYQQYGTIYFTIDGKEYALAVYQNLELKGQEKYKEYLFLPFKDLTNGDSSYGGGRYLNLSIQDVEVNKIPLDFNKAYNPWCAYSDGFNCPIPPKVNHLDLAIEAGEKKFKKK
ncbi:MAG: DUF1684 domain-containing protein [Bacteroidota bacterium]